MKNKNMVFGSNEATTLTTGTNKVQDSSLTGTPVKFGIGAFDATRMNEVAKAADDSKLRFVYEAGSHSGMVFAGNHLVSSRILNIVTNEKLKATYNVSTGEWESSETVKVADKVTVTWYGQAYKWDKGVLVEDTDGDFAIRTTEFDIIDRDSVNEMIKAAQAELQKELDDLEAKHAEDTSRLDSSVSGIEDFLKATEVSEAADGAVTVDTSTDANGYKSYTVGVKVNETTVKVVDDKLAVATYSIDKLNDGEDGYDANWAAQYRLMMQAPDSSTAVQVGETINIMKDFLVKSAHVCTFKYVAEEGAEIDYSEGASQWGTTTSISIGDPIVAGQLPWAKLANGTWEEAKLGNDIKYGHTYLHLILNTKDDDEKIDGSTGNDQLTDVYLDFTEIFESFKGDGEFITIGSDGVVALDEDAVTEYVDSSLGISDKFNEIDSSIDALQAEDASLEAHLATTDASLADYIDTTDEHLAQIDASIDALQNVDASVIYTNLDNLNSSVNAIEDSYLTDVVLSAPKAENSQFNELTITKKADGTESQVSVDIANASFYNALNDALETLQANDNYLSGLLTWEEL